MKNSRGRGIQSITFKQVSIEKELILEFIMYCNFFLELISNMQQNKFVKPIQE